MLLLQPVWSAGKYILPMIPFFLIFVARSLVRLSSKQSGNDAPMIQIRARWADHLKGSRVGYPTIILLVFLLSNAIYIGNLAVKQVNDNIRYVRGDKYAGYPPEARQMFLEMERAKGLPDNVVLVCRKPEFLYLVSGKKSIYPWEVKEER